MITTGSVTAAAAATRYLRKQETTSIDTFLNFITLRRWNNSVFVGKLLFTYIYSVRRLYKPPQVAEYVAKTNSWCSDGSRSKSEVSPMQCIIL